MTARILALICLFSLAGCSSPDSPSTPQDPRVQFNLHTLPELSYPVDNQKSKYRFVLGWRLFYDPILSGTKDVACGTCHHSRFGMSDARAFSLGVEASGLGPARSPNGGMKHETARHSPSV